MEVGLVNSAGGKLAEADAIAREVHAGAGFDEEEADAFAIGETRGAELCEGLRDGALGFAGEREGLRPGEKRDAGEQLREEGLPCLWREGLEELGFEVGSGHAERAESPVREPVLR